MPSKDAITLNYNMDLDLRRTWSNSANGEKRLKYQCPSITNFILYPYI